MLSYGSFLYFRKQGFFADAAAASGAQYFYISKILQAVAGIDFTGKKKNGREKGILLGFSGGCPVSGVKRNSRWCLHPLIYHPSITDQQLTEQTDALQAGNGCKKE